MKWLSNIIDPEQPLVNQNIHRFWNETQAQAVNKHEQWLIGKCIGRPKATLDLSVEDLENDHYVGVYLPETAAERVAVA